MSEAFISYSRADSAFADKLQRDLEARGIPVWIDRDNIEGGAAWRASISTAIRSCCAFILILSPRSTQSGQVSKELSVAETHNRLIIPVVIEKCDIPPGMELQLAELQWISFAEHPYDAALERLTRVINDARSRTADAKTPDTQDMAQRASPAVAPASPPRRASSDKAPPTASSRSSRKWLLAGAVMIVAVASVSTFRHIQGSGSTAADENVARVDGKAARAETSAATATDSKSSVVPAVAQASSDVQRAEPPKPETTVEPTAAPAKERAETQTPKRAAPPTSAPAGAGREAAQTVGQQEPMAAPEKPAMVARADPAPGRASPVVVGNTRTLLYHFAECPGYSRIRPEARIEFPSAREAERAGYKLSDNCADPSGGRPAAGVIANSRTRDYFLPHCKGYAATRPEYRVPFNSATEAEQAGYRRTDKCS